MAQSRRSRKQWLELVEGWVRSGLSQQAYCTRHGISLGSLRRWRQIYREEHEGAGVRIKATADQAHLVPVELLGCTHSPPSTLSVVLANGVRIEIAPDFDVPALKCLLTLLREAP